MHDVIKKPSLPAPAKGPRYAALHRKFPTILHSRDHARRHAPRFTFEYADGGAGADTGIARNWAALDAVELVARYGVTTSLPAIDVELLVATIPRRSASRRWAVPRSCGPAQNCSQSRARARVPYVLGLVGGATIEQIAEAAPDVFWFQLYRCAKNDHLIGSDLVKRADAAGVHVLMLTLDVPVRTTRSREVAVGLSGVGSFRPDLSMMWDIVRSPGWALAMMKTANRVL